MMSLPRDGIMLCVGIFVAHTVLIDESYALLEPCDAASGSMAEERTT